MLIESRLLKQYGVTMQQVENAIECMKKDGSIPKLHEKWFGLAPAATSAAVRIFPGFGAPGMPGYDPREHALTCS